MNTLVTTLTAIAAANPYGFTYNVESGEMQTTGYCVALECTQNSHGLDGLENVINIVTNGDTGATCIGGWMDEQTGLYYFDATVIVEDRAAAIALGRLLTQRLTADLQQDALILQFVQTESPFPIYPILF